MWPAHDLAVHARLSTCAPVTAIRILTVVRMGNEPERDPHGNTLPVIFPRYTEPVRVRVVLNVNPLIPPESRTAHGPAAHFGLASHVSSHLLGLPLRVENPG
jgi:hypothetical protein